MHMWETAAGPIGILKLATKTAQITDSAPPIDESVAQHRPSTAHDDAETLSATNYAQAGNEIASDAILYDEKISSTVVFQAHSANTSPPSIQKFTARSPHRWIRIRESACIGRSAHGISFELLLTETAIPFSNVFIKEIISHFVCVATSGMCIFQSKSNGKITSENYSVIHTIPAPNLSYSTGSKAVHEAVDNHLHEKDQTKVPLPATTSATVATTAVYRPSTVSAKAQLLPSAFWIGIAQIFSHTHSQ